MAVRASDHAKADASRHYRDIFGIAQLLVD